MATNFSERVLKIKLEFISPVLGSSPNDKEIYTNYVGSKAPDAKTLAEEVASVGVANTVDSKTTVFLMDEDGNPYISQHVIKGFFKEAASAIKSITGNKYATSKIKAHKKRINDLVHVYPNKLFIKMPDGLSPEECITTNQRPLRAQTPLGDRVALASSEEIPEGATIEFEVELMDKALEPALIEWLDYGRYKGLCQWRNAGYGRFEWMEIK